VGIEESNLSLPLHKHTNEIDVLMKGEALPLS